MPLEVAYDYVQDLVWDGALQSKNQLHTSVCKITLLKVYDPYLYVTYTGGPLPTLLSDLLQHEVDEFAKHRNTHTIRQSRADCIGGIPDDLYDMPQNYGQLFWKTTFTLK